MKPLVLIRADAGLTIGTGHVMRCLALAQAWQDAGGEATFVAASGLPDRLRSRLEREKMDVVILRAEPGGLSDARETAELASKRGAAWIAVDGYHFDSTYQQRLRHPGHRVLWIDDEAHAAPYSADLVLNQNPYASESMYAARDNRTGLLLGLRYALLRREFRHAAASPAGRPGRRVLVTLGGADAHNVTMKAVDALDGLEVEVVVVAGSGNPHVPALRERIASENRIRLVENAFEMAALMAWADVAIAGAGTTCWELAHAGLPAVVVVVADNQRRAAELLARDGVVVSAGWHAELTAAHLQDAMRSLLDDPDRRSAMAAHGRSMVDGRGSERTVRRMLQHGKESDEARD